METTDLIFWYTGWVAWAIIAVLVLLAVCLGLYAAYNAARQWKALYRFKNVDASMIRASMPPFRGLFGKGQSDEIINWLIKLSHNLQEEEDRGTLALAHTGNEFEVGEKVLYKLHGAHEGHVAEVVQYSRMGGTCTGVYEIKWVEDEEGDEDEEGNAVRVRNLYAWDLEKLVTETDEDD